MELRQSLIQRRPLASFEESFETIAYSMIMGSLGIGYGQYPDTPTGLRWPDQMSIVLRAHHSVQYTTGGLKLRRSLPHAVLRSFACLGRCPVMSE